MPRNSRLRGSKTALLKDIRANCSQNK